MGGRCPNVAHKAPGSIQVQVVMTKSQLADYTRRVMDGAEGVRRDQCDEEWDLQYKNREVRDWEGRDKEGDKSPSPGEGCLGRDKKCVR